MTMALAAGAAGYLLILGLLFAFQRSLLYLPNRTPPDLATAGMGGVLQAVRLRTEDGLELVAWWGPPPAPEAPVLLYFHGNAGHIGHRAEHLRPYLDAGFGLLLPEYRGYGGNPGSPSEAGFYRDARAAYEFLASQGVAAERFVLYGESLGTGVAVQMATERACAALVLEAPFTSVAAVAQSRYWMFPVRALTLDRFDSLAKIGAVRCPLFLMHGEQDRVVPIGYGRALFAAAAEPKQAKWYAEVGHTGFDEFGAPAAVLAFLRQHGVIR